MDFNSRHTLGGFVPAWGYQWLTELQEVACCTRAATARTAADAPPCRLFGNCQDGENRPGRNQRRGQTRYGAEHSYGDVSTTDLALWGKFTWSLCRVLDDPQCRAPVHGAEKFVTGLHSNYTAHWNWNVWPWNINIDKPDIKQLKTLKTKNQKLPLKNNHPGHAGFGDLLFFYLTLNLELMKTSRLMVLEHETLCRQENLTGETRTACLHLISSPAPVLGRPPLQRRTPPWSLWPDCEYDSSFDSAFCSTGSPQKTGLGLFSYFTKPWDNTLFISCDLGWILIGITG